MRTLITKEDWNEIKRALAKAQVGYTVSFDAHHSTTEKIIEINPFGIYDYFKEGDKNEEN